MSEDPIIGRRIGGEPEDESEHFYRCAACAQPVDMRDLAQVFHHEEPGHGPFQNPQRIAAATLLLDETLADRNPDDRDG